MGKVGSLGNDTSTERVGCFGVKIGETIIYYNFGHLLDVLKGSVSEGLMDVLSRDVSAHAIDIF